MLHTEQRYDKIALVIWIVWEKLIINRSKEMNPASLIKQRRSKRTDSEGRQAPAKNFNYPSLPSPLGQ